MSVVSRTFLSILGKFSSVIPRTITILPLVSSSSSPFIRFLETVLRDPTISITFTFMFLSFYSYLAKSTFILSHSLSLWSPQTRQLYSFWVFHTSVWYLLKVLDIYILMVSLNCTVCFYAFLEISERFQ